MFGQKKRRRDKARLQTLEQIELVEVALLRRVLPMIERDHGKESSAVLARSVVDVLLAKPRNGNGKKQAIATELASAIAEADKQIRDGLFVSLRAILAIAGDTDDFAGERRILETMRWLKRFGEMPPNSHEPEALIGLALALEASALIPATPLSARN